MAIPAFKIKINNQPIAENVRKSIFHVECDLQIAIASEITLFIHDPNYNITDSNTFEIGSEIDIEIGYGSKFNRLLLADIVSIEPGISEASGATVIVRGYDKSYRLRRNKPVRPPYLNTKDSDIAEQIAREAGLNTEIESTPIIHSFLQQTGSDWNFLKERAKANAFEAYVQFDTLYFRNSRKSLAQVHELKRNRDILDLNLRLSAVDQPNLYVVRGWDSMQKQLLLAKTTPQSAEMKAEGQKTGAQITSEAFGESRNLLYDRPISSQDEAEHVAQSQFQNAARSFIEGEGICLGKPEMKAGDKLELLNMGKKFSGTYFITQAKHIISTQGYRTKFSIERNAL